MFSPDLGLKTVINKKLESIEIKKNFVIKIELYYYCNRCPNPIKIGAVQATFTMLLDAIIDLTT
jgi:hypothetical protein